MAQQDHRKLLKIIIAIFIPPLSAFLHSGISEKFWISLILTFVGFLPGVLYTLYIILAVPAES